MADRKNRRIVPILLIFMFGIVLISIQIIFRWRSATLDNAIKSPDSAGDLLRLRDLADRLAWYRPDDIDLVLRRAEFADRAGDSLAAAAILASVPDSSPAAARARYLEGLVHRNAFRLDDAEMAFRASIRIDPKMVDAHRQLVALYGVEHRGAEQVDALNAWIRSGFGVLEPLRLLGQSVVVIPPGTLDKSTDEGAILERALKTQPESRHIRPALARFYRNRGELAAAKHLLDDWLSKHPDDMDAGIEKLATFVDSGDDDEADRFAGTLDDSARGKSPFWLVLGDLKRNQQGWEDAARCYRKSISLDPRNPETYYRLAECLRSIGREEESALSLKTHSDIRKLAEAAAAVDTLRPNGPAIMAAARLCAESGRMFEARAWASEALRIDRNDAEARALLNRIEADHSTR